MPTDEELAAALKRTGLGDAPPPDPVPSPRPRSREKPVEGRLAIPDYPTAWAEYVEEERRGDAGAVTFGWRTIDSPDTGLGKPVRPGEVVIVGARTGIGKTWAAQHVIERRLVTDDTVGVLDFTMEMTAYQMAERMGGHALSLSTRELGQRVLAGTADLAAVMAAAPEYERIRFYEGTTSIDTIPEAIDQAEESLGIAVGLIVIDYTQLLAWKGPRNATLTEQATMNARRLKDVTKQRRVITIACAQLSRAGGGAGMIEPSMDALRESGAAEEAADRILMLWRDAPTKDDDGKPVRNPEHEIRVKIEKNRHGPRGARALLRYDHAMRLGEVDEYAIEQQLLEEARGDDIPF